MENELGVLQVFKLPYAKELLVYFSVTESL